MSKLKKVIFLFVAGLVFFTACTSDHTVGSGKTGDQDEKVLRGKYNYAYKWAELALVATGHDTERFKPRPTVTSRYLGLVMVTMYDAWTRYDSTAAPVYLDGVERRPAQERTEHNKEIAISYAAYSALREYYYSDTVILRQNMLDLDLDPNNKSLDPNTPEGIGNLAAKAVIEARKHDGSNQYGDEAGSNGEPYFNYVKYQPVNNPDKNSEIDRWQPKYFADGKGGKFCPPCLTPFWQNVKPIGLKSSDQFRSPPPPESRFSRNGS